MKSFTFLFCMLLAAVSAGAQDFTHQDTSLYWFTAHDNTSMSGTTHTESSEHFLGRDTVIRGNTYQQLYNGYQLRFMRTDAQNRTYGLDTRDTVETLYFAWNAQVGDTISFKGYIGDPSGQSAYYIYAVDSIDSMDINGSLRKAIHVSTNIPYGVTGVYFQLTWIEGIGEQHTGLHSVFVPDIYNGFSFCGIYQDSAYVYTANLNCFELTSITGIPDADRIQIYPTPADDAITLTNNTSERLTTYKLVGITGERVYDGILDSQERNSIPLKGLSTGVYFLLVSDDEGHVYKERIVKR